MSKLTINKNVLGREVYRAALSPDGATWSKAGSYTWTCPAGVTSITVETYGAGGGGGGSGANNLFGVSGGGGGGGGYSKATGVVVSPGTSYTVVVGQGGAGGTTGAGAAGTASTFNGGTSGGGGGGGGVATGTGGTAGAAGTGLTTNGTAGGAGLTTGTGNGGAGAGPGGGAGGAVGGDLTGPASDGSNYGGGGGGALADSTPNSPGGNGADGAVQLSWAGTSEPVYVAGCESPCSTYYLARRVGTISGVPVYAYGTKCCKYPAADLSNNPLTVGFHETTTFPPGISDYVTVVISGNNCPVLGSDHCKVGELKYGAVAWSPSGFGWTGTVAGLALAMWVDQSCTNKLRFCITSACGAAIVANGPSDGCGSCAASPCGTPCNYMTVSCAFPLRASVSYTLMGHCCAGTVSDCTSHASIQVVGYCRRNFLGRLAQEPTFPPGTPELGGPVGGPAPGTFTEGPDCPCPPAAFCPKLSPPCCDISEACNCTTLTGTVSNGAGTLTCFNGASGSLPCASLVGTVRTWAGTISFSSCGGITAFSASVTCDSSTGRWTASLQAGATCSFGSGAVTSVDCANRTVHFSGLVGSGLTCSGSSLDFTITW